MPTKKQDELFAAHLQGVIHYHARMLADPVRNALLRRAIEKTLKPGMDFLDVGAGSGVWAILAAKLGAKRVVAVELEEALIPMIFKHAQENGVANKIEIVHGNVDDVKIKGRFDVIVSELFSNNAFGDATVNSFISLRKRFLKPGGALIPQRLEMWAVPILKQASNHRLPAKLPLDTEFLRSLKLNYPFEMPLSDVRSIKFAAKPKKLIELNFPTIEKPLVLADLSAEWKLKNISRINAFGAFQRSVFADGIELDCRESQSWSMAKYDFEPFDVKNGIVRLSINLDPKNGSSRISLPSHPDIGARTYSPVFAFTRTRMAQAVTPHKRYGGSAPKTSKRKSR
jgi:SAM-dependent methyltransferase